MTTALPLAPRLGVHLPHKGRLVPAASRAIEIGAQVVQVFADNPTAWRRRVQPPKQLPVFRERLASHGVAPLAIHASYLINLASPDETFWQRSVATLAAELRAAAVFGARLVNVHIGSHRGSGTQAGLARIGLAVRRALEEAGRDGTGEPMAAPLLVLEDSAGGGDGMGGPLEELAAVLDACAAAGADTRRVAFCLDTAHLWGAGHAIDTAEGVAVTLETFGRLVGSERLAMVHLNDSKAALGSHLDRHEHIGAGHIGPAGLGALLRHPALAGLPVILETPRMDEGFDAHNLARARLLLAGAQELPPLPEEAAPAAPRQRSRTTRKCPPPPSTA
ncbi:MAG TPA: deoxyribonuclease IV [Candidatus Limnocylindrales bacterium]|nr:deoxyribonuclease IV [Candidatus Limnocylindrales bacterium]